MTNPFSEYATLYLRPYYSTLFRKIRAFIGYIKIERLKYNHPSAESHIDKAIEFRKTHASVLVNRVDLFFIQIEARGHEKVLELYNENNMAWKKYAANVNRLSHTNKLLPEAFANMVRDKLPYYLKAIVFESKKAKPGDAAHKLQPGRVE